MTQLVAHNYEIEVVDMRYTLITMAQRVPFFQVGETRFHKLNI